MTAADYGGARRVEGVSSRTKNQAEAQRPAQVVDYVPHCSVYSELNSAKNRKGDLAAVR